MTDTTDRPRRRSFLAALFLALALGLPAAPTHAAPATDEGTVLITIFLKHDESKTLDEINAELERNGFYKAFPPEGTTVESWYVMMGIGQVVTLRVPAAKVRDVNVAIEKTAWKAYRTEFYLTYDYRALAREQREKILKKEK
jgi:hypothetical protein